MQKAPLFQYTCGDGGLESEFPVEAAALRTFVRHPVTLLAVSSITGENGSSKSLRVSTSIFVVFSVISIVDS